MPGYILSERMFLFKYHFRLFSIFQAIHHQNICPEKPCSALRRLDRILLYPINAWVTENIKKHEGSAGIYCRYVTNHGLPNTIDDTPLIPGCRYAPEIYTIFSIVSSFPKYHFDVLNCLKVI